MKVKLSYLLLVAALALSSCSTTRILGEDQARLTRNNVIVSSSKKFNTGELTTYIKQKGSGWSPFMCVYNWQNGKGKGWDRFVTKIGTAPVVFDSTLVYSSVENLKEHLTYLGYYNSSIESRVVSKGKKKVGVNYYVTLGKQYPISSIRYTIPTAGTFPKDFYPDTLNRSIRIGDCLSEAALEKESVRSSAALRDKGYYGFSKNFFFFEADTLSTPDSARLHIILKNHTRNESEEARTEFAVNKIGSIKVTYPADMKMRPEVLRDLNTLHTGDIYSESKVSNTYSRFSSVSLFNSVSVAMTPRENNVVDCSIDLQKGKVRGFKLGLEGSVNSSGLLGIAPELTYYNKNIFHGGEWFSMSVSANNQFQFKGGRAGSLELSGAASLSLPCLFPLSNRHITGPNIPRTEINASYNYQRRPEYTRHIIRLTYGYKGVFHKNLYYQFIPLSWNTVRMNNIDADFESTLANNPFLKNAFQDHFDLGVSGALSYNSTWYARLNLDLSGNVVALFKRYMSKNADGAGLVMGIPFSQYVRGELTLGKTFHFGANDKHQLALRLNGGAGYAYGNSSVIPFEKHFYGGGSNSLRGWIARTVGPGSEIQETNWVIPNQTGNMKLEANIEYRFPLVWKLSGALFYDAGNVWNFGPTASPGSKFSFDTVAMDWGLGLRVDINVLVLRLDAGFQVYDPSRLSKKITPWLGPKEWFDSSYAIHFGVGYPF